MKQIRRIPVNLKDPVTFLDMAAEAKVLNVEKMGDAVYMHILEVPDQPHVRREFHIAQTGKTFDGKGLYLGSAGHYHFFEK